MKTKYFSLIFLIIAVTSSYAASMVIYKKREYQFQIKLLMKINGDGKNIIKSCRY